MRGYTSISERLPPSEVTALLNRFYETGSRALLPHGALLGQIAGDEIMALFVPGLAGPAYRRNAVEAARALLRAVGYESSAANWIGVGVGIASGEEFVGNLGGGGYKDFTAVGDVTNTAARLTAVAQGGEILVDAATYEAVAATYLGVERRQLVLKGKEAAVQSFLIPVS